MPGVSAAASRVREARQEAVYRTQDDVVAARWMMEYRVAVQAKEVALSTEVHAEHVTDAVVAQRVALAEAVSDSVESQAHRAE